MNTRKMGAHYKQFIGQGIQMVNICGDTEHL